MILGMITMHKLKKKVKKASNMLKTADRQKIGKERNYMIYAHR